MEGRHIAIIMDGNRRFSKRLVLDPCKGHEYGAKKVRNVLRWCKNAGFKIVTLYSFSIQNIGRPKLEFNYLMNLFKNEFNSVANDKEVHEEKMRINVIGRTQLLPKDVQDAIKKAENATKDYDNFTVNFAIAYGGQEEITDAVRDIVGKVSSGDLRPADVNKDLIKHSLYTNGMPAPDLIIRTGGEKRLSNFLLFQSAYSELFFSDSMWPEFSKEDFGKIMEEFKNRKRRFGK